MKDTVIERGEIHKELYKRISQIENRISKNRLNLSEAKTVNEASYALFDYQSKDERANRFKCDPAMMLISSIGVYKIERQIYNLLRFDTGCHLRLKMEEIIQGKQDTIRESGIKQIISDGNKWIEESGRFAIGDVLLSNTNSRNTVKNVLQVVNAEDYYVSNRLVEEADSLLKENQQHDDLNALTANIKRLIEQLSICKKKISNTITTLQDTQIKFIDDINQIINQYQNNFQQYDALHLNTIIQNAKTWMHDHLDQCKQYDVSVEELRNLCAANANKRIMDIQRQRNQLLNTINEHITNLNQYDDLLQGKENLHALPSLKSTLEEAKAWIENRKEMCVNYDISDALSNLDTLYKKYIKYVKQHR